MPITPSMPNSGPGAVPPQAADASTNTASQPSGPPLSPRVQDARHHGGASNPESQAATAGPERANATVAPAGVPRTAAPRQPPDRLGALPADVLGKLTGYLNLPELKTLQETSAGTATKLTTKGPAAAVLAASKPDAPWKLEIRARLDRLDEESKRLTHRQQQPGYWESPASISAGNAEFAAINCERDRLQCELAEHEGVVIADAARFGRVAAPISDAEEARSEIGEFLSTFEREMEALGPVPTPQSASKAVELLHGLAPRFEVLNSRGEKVAFMPIVNGLLHQLTFEQKKAVHGALRHSINDETLNSMRSLLAPLQDALELAIDEMQTAFAAYQAPKRELLAALTSHGDVKARAALANDILNRTQEIDIPGLSLDDAGALESFNTVVSEVAPDQAPLMQVALGEFNSSVASKEVMHVVKRFQATLATGQDPIIAIVDDGEPPQPLRELTPWAQVDGAIRNNLNVMLEDLLNILGEESTPRARMSHAMNVLQESLALRDEIQAAGFDPIDAVRSQLEVTLTPLQPEQLEAVRSSVLEIKDDEPPETLKDFLDAILAALPDKS